MTTNQSLVDKFLQTMKLTAASEVNNSGLDHSQTGTVIQYDQTQTKPYYIQMGDSVVQARSSGAQYYVQDVVYVTQYGGAEEYVISGLQSRVEGVITNTTIMQDYDFLSGNLWSASGLDLETLKVLTTSIPKTGDNEEFIGGNTLFMTFNLNGNVSGATDSLVTVTIDNSENPFTFTIDDVQGALTDVNNEPQMFIVSLDKTPTTVQIELLSSVQITNFKVFVAREAYKEKTNSLVIAPIDKYKFTSGDNSTSTITLAAQLRKNGLVEELSDTSCYWFIEEPLVDSVEDGNYSIYGGKGWRALNEVDTETKELKPMEAKVDITFNQVQRYNVGFKCITTDVNGVKETSNIFRIINDAVPHLEVAYNEETQVITTALKIGEDEIDYTDYTFSIPSGTNAYGEKLTEDLPTLIDKTHNFQVDETKIGIFNTYIVEAIWKGNTLVDRQSIKVEKQGLFGGNGTEALTLALDNDSDIFVKTKAGEIIGAEKDKPLAVINVTAYAGSKDVTFDKDSFIDLGTVTGAMDAQFVFDSDPDPNSDSDKPLAQLQIIGINTSSADSKGSIEIVWKNSDAEDAFVYATKKFTYNIITANSDYDLILSKTVVNTDGKNQADELSTITVQKKLPDGSIENLQGPDEYIKVTVNDVDWGTYKDVWNPIKLQQFQVTNDQGKVTGIRDVKVEVVSTDISLNNLVWDTETIEAVQNGAQGEQGAPGGKGDSIATSVTTQYAYYLCNSATFPTNAPTSPTNENNELNTGWSFSSSSLSASNQYEYISERTKKETSVNEGAATVTYGDWKESPTLWAKFGADGNNASVTRINTMNALTNGLKEVGIYYVDEDGNKITNQSQWDTAAGLYINASMINSGALQVANSDGNTVFYADVDDDVITLGNFTVTAESGTGKLYSGKSSFDDTAAGVYLGTDGIAISGDNGGFKVDTQGNADFTGIVNATGFTIDDQVALDAGLSTKDYTDQAEQNAISKAEELADAAYDDAVAEAQNKVNAAYEAAVAEAQGFADAAQAAAIAEAQKEDETIAAAAAAAQGAAATASENAAAANTQIANWGSGSTTIVGGATISQPIYASHLKADIIKSSNCNTVYNTGYTDNGTYFDLTTGALNSKNFCITSGGDAKFKGYVEANGGSIGNLVLEDGALFTKDKTSTNGVNGVYISASQIKLGSNFQVSQTGSMTASAGKIGGWFLGNNILASVNTDSNNWNTELTNGGIILDPNHGIKLGTNFSVDTQGNVIANNAVVTGTVTAEKGDIGGWEIYENETGKGIKADDFQIISNDNSISNDQNYVYINEFFRWTYYESDCPFLESDNESYVAFIDSEKLEIDIDNRTTKIQINYAYLEKTYQDSIGATEKIEEMEDEYGNFRKISELLDIEKNTNTWYLKASTATIEETSDEFSLRLIIQGYYTIKIPAGNSSVEPTYLKIGNDQSLSTEYLTLSFSTDSNSCFTMNAGKLVFDVTKPFFSSVLSAISFYDASVIDAEISYVNDVVEGDFSVVDGKPLYEYLAVSTDGTIYPKQYVVLYEDDVESAILTIRISYKTNNFMVSRSGKINSPTINYLINQLSNTSGGSTGSLINYYTKTQADNRFYNKTDFPIATLEDIDDLFNNLGQS